MSKRIVILVKGKSTFEDSSKNLNYLDDDIKLISKTLKDHGGWELSSVIKLGDPQDIKDALLEYAEYAEILFYYTGHGQVDTNSSEFNLVGNNDEKISLEKIFRDCKEDIKNCCLTLVIDACRSGYFIDEAHKPNVDCEILTATNHGKAFKKVDENISFFTNLFCEYIENKSKDGKPIYLKEIGLEIKKASKDSFEIKEQSMYTSQQKQPVQYFFPERLYGKRKSIIANQSDIKTATLPEDEDIFLTIEIQPHGVDQYYVYIWEEWKAPDGNNVLKNNSPEERLYKKEEISSMIDRFRKDNYSHIEVAKIFLTFILPSELMSEKINFWKLKNGRFLGSEYSILLRGRERFFTEGVNKNRDWYDIGNWKDNWSAYKKKQNECIESVSCPIDCADDEDEITSREVLETPFALMHYTPSSISFINLYKAGFPIIMWANDCKDFNKFKKLFEEQKYKNIKFGELHRKLSQFKSRHTELEKETNIMLIYDNPELLPYDENASKLTNPKGG